jgi:transcriptional regulator with XRE-family HTH domain
MGNTTFASRVREARADAGLSQSELARAIARITKTKMNKSLVSQWELGRVKNPQIETLSALVAVTGFTHDYLSTGKGPKKASLSAALHAAQEAKPLNRTALARAVTAVFEQTPTSAAQAGDVALSLYDILVESPGTDAAALRQMARLLVRSVADLPVDRSPSP